MTELNIYKELLNAIGAAGDAITKFVDGVKHLIVTGASGYNYLSAERDRKRLLEISALATNLQTRAQGKVVRNLDEYLSKKNPTPHDWYAAREGIASVIDIIEYLLDDLGKDRSDFVLESTYFRLLETMDARLALISRLYRLPPPSSSEEKNALRELNAEYKKLLEAFREAIKQLNIYLKKSDGA